MRKVCQRLSKEIGFGMYYVLLSLVQVPTLS